MALMGIEGAAWRSVTLAGTDSDHTSECPMHPITLVNRCAHFDGRFCAVRVFAGRYRVEFGYDADCIVYMSGYKDTWIEAKRLFEMWIARELGVEAT